jgi:hypothetical protein
LVLQVSVVMLGEIAERSKNFSGSEGDVEIAAEKLAPDNSYHVKHVIE